MWYNTITPTPFGFQLAWNMFFYLFSLNLCLPLKLKWASWMNHLVGSCYFIYPVSLCFLIGEFNSLMFRAVIDIDLQLFQQYLLRKLSLLYIVFVPLSKTIFICIYFWLFYSVSFIYLSILTSIPYCLAYCSFMVILEVR